jgi:hypothetical protein
MNQRFDIEEMIEKLFGSKNELKDLIVPASLVIEEKTDGNELA